MNEFLEIVDCDKIIVFTNFVKTDQGEFIAERSITFDDFPLAELQARAWMVNRTGIPITSDLISIEDVEFSVSNETTKHIINIKGIEYRCKQDQFVNLLNKTIPYVTCLIVLERELLPM